MGGWGGGERDPAPTQDPIRYCDVFFQVRSIQVLYSIQIYKSKQ